MAADPNTVRVHFKGWASKWDETLSRASNKLAELGTYTSGKDTGWSKRQQGLPCKLSGNELLAIGDKLRHFTAPVSVDGAAPSSPFCAGGSGGSAATTFEQFWRDDVVPAVDWILTSSFADCADVPIANNFLREVIDVLIKALQDRQFTMGRHQLLSRILMLEE